MASTDSYCGFVCQKNETENLLPSFFWKVLSFALHDDYEKVSQVRGETRQQKRFQFILLFEAPSGGGKSFDADRERERGETLNIDKWQ